ncbi:MAG: hypothetical protein WCI30_00910 [Clostridia bacterium]
MIKQQDKEIMYTLASRLAEIAAEPLNLHKKKEWIVHNAMGKTSPRVVVFPENSWHEIIPEQSLQIEDEFLRAIERDLREKIYHWEHFKDDMVFEPIYRMRAVYDDHFEWGMKPEKKYSGVQGGAYEMVATLKTEDDFQRMAALSHNWDFDDAETQRRQELLTDIFKDTLQVKPCIPFYTSSMIFQLVPLYGLTELMMDLVLKPEHIHKIMEFMSNSLLHAFKKLETEKRIISNNNGIFLPSGSLGYTDELKLEEAEGPFSLQDLWGFADTQEFTDVSPAMWREFVWPYQKKLLKEFGLVYYGCCEKLDKKYEDILALPNIRKISVSPWSDIHIAAEKIGRKAIYCRKFSPAEVIYGFEETKIKSSTKELLEVSKDCNLEIILKDLHTCDYKPENITRWIEVVQSECK